MPGERYRTVAATSVAAVSEPGITRGRFFVVEGPDAVGKSTTAALIAEELATTCPVALTREPTDTDLGRLIRRSEATLTGRALALAVAADRYAHLDQFIAPAVTAGTVVISDRYVPSSLVLQQIDGLPVEEIWRYNQYATIPDITFYLDASAATLTDRLADRPSMSRLERQGRPQKQIDLYRAAAQFLDGHGWRQRRVHSDALAPRQVAEEILQMIRRDLVTGANNAP